MNDTLESLRHKIEGAHKLESVVRTMKALSAASISQYERAVLALENYHRTVQLGLLVCFRQVEQLPLMMKKQATKPESVTAIVFGAGQGLVGPFNDVIVNFLAAKLRELPGKKAAWAVGESIRTRLEDVGLSPEQLFVIPNSVHTIIPLVGEVLTHIERTLEARPATVFYLFHNRPVYGSGYQPESRAFIPLDEIWRQELAGLEWPSKNVPEAMGQVAPTLTALIREYLFSSLFKACAESLASENASRLAAMQRAEKNIQERSNNLSLAFHRLRQEAIDEELFDLIAGAEALEGH
ncbi:MAG: F0F1 ATP synthase subunit gamma [Phaeodactylibacter sp.]|nr:F0F1 ATP synthase subunit gamma [Phaeodactylibacter sp.]MCB9264249.1 F0F1 ATP synthase subunit gamma [Lewinellaceae bacterium]MCB9291233.1 F0F1 ATP synthase subunit gamma [Lewinellaceae bacterium]